MEKEAMTEALVSLLTGATPVEQRTGLNRAFYVFMVLGVGPVAHAC